MSVVFFNLKVFFFLVGKRAYSHLFQSLGNSSNGTGKNHAWDKKEGAERPKGAGGYSTERIAEQRLVKLKSLREISCWFGENPCDSSIK